LISVPESISKLYVSSGVVVGGVHVKELPVKPVAMVETRVCAAGSPPLSFKVTGAVAPVHVMVKGLPATMPAKAVLVNSTSAAARAERMAATRNLENCMLIDC